VAQIVRAAMVCALDARQSSTPINLGGPWRGAGRAQPRWTSPGATASVIWPSCGWQPQPFRGERGRRASVKVDC